MATTTTPTNNDRIEQFKSDVAGMKLKTGAGSTEQALQVLGAILMVAGVIVAIIAYQQGLSKADIRDVTSKETMAIVGLAVSVVGAAIFLRYSLAKFFRLWLLRQMYEGQANVARLVGELKHQS
jgi:hypothetical protein